MVRSYTAVLDACLQLLELLISVAILVGGFVGGFAAVAPNSFLTLKRKARVLKIRALRALDSTTGAATRSAPADWATDRVTALPDIWALVAEHSGFVGAWRLTGVCTAAREGATVWLRTLPGLVMCGGIGCGPGSPGWYKSDVWRLDLAELRWDHTSDLALARASPVCCAVRGGVVVLGGQLARFRPGENTLEDCFTASVEILGSNSETGEQIFRALPPLSCSPIINSAAVVVDESESEQGQVLLIGGDDGRTHAGEVHKVDLATGVCTPLPSLLSTRREVCTAARLPDGRVVCVGKNVGDSEGITAEVLPAQGSLTTAASWRWRQLPGMRVAWFGCGGCVLSDGRFAIFGGQTDFGFATITALCEVLVLDGHDRRWEPLPPMHEARTKFACSAVGRCVIVAGGDVRGTAEVYEEALGLWRRLPCSLPDHAGICWMGSALMQRR
jgi:hypothetical protein